MNTLTKTLLLPAFLGFMLGCRSTDSSGKVTSDESPPPVADRINTKDRQSTAKAGGAFVGFTNALRSNPQFTRPLYIVKAGGAYVGITNAPSSNSVPVSFARWGTFSGGDEGAFFRLTNAESHAILVWNVRVQVPAVGPAADPSGWDSFTDDYPAGPGSAKLAPGASGEFWAKRPSVTPWRVCFLYSKDWTDSGQTYSSNYEVISQEMKE